MEVGPAFTARDATELLDWRRRVAELYAAVRRDYADDPVGAHRLWREGRDELFATHPQSPLPSARRRTFRGLAVADYDGAYADAAPLLDAAERLRFPVATSGQGSIDFLLIGAVDVPWGRLEVYWLDVYGGGLFLPLRDATAGTRTYGGGRYLLDTVKGADLGATDGGDLILDLNFSYHPSCVYDPSWSCPLAPPANRVDVALPVGELLPDP